MNYWDRAWAEYDVSDFSKYIDPKQDCVFIDYFRRYNVRNVCDIGCGFGKYSVISSYNGFNVYGIDISDYAVRLTENMIKSFGLQHGLYKVCTMSEILFEDNFFDGIIAHAVIDHLTMDEAKKSIKEISRVTKPGGLVYISFDGLSDEDLDCDHETKEDGTMIYGSGDREGLMFRYYEDNDIRQLLDKYAILHFEKNSRGDREVIYRNSTK